jgi:hypothetical protein
MKRHSRKNIRKRNLRNRRGQAYVEFIVVLPGVLLLLLLAWEFSYFWWSRMVVSTATFEAARQVAAGEPASSGYAVYDEILSTGMGQMAEEHRGRFFLAVQPRLRSVRAQANVPYRWPTGLGALMGGGMDLSLQSSAFFRLEQAQFGPPGDQFE